MKLDFKPPFCIVGAGKTGEALWQLLLALGYRESQLCFFEDKASASKEKISFNDPTELFNKFQPQTLLVSPGYPLKKEWIQRAEQAGVLVSSELELVGAHLAQEKMMGVTGSLGKSTTVSLIGEAVKCVDSEAFVGGNLGIPLASYLEQVLRKKRKAAQWIVLELSSYQLERSRNLKCAASIVTYFSPNHLDRYESLESYYATKWQLVEKTEGPVVLNARSTELTQFWKKQKTNKEILLVHSDQGPLNFSALQESRLVGKHQWDNLSCVVALVQKLGWPWDCAWDQLRKFSGLSHRLEFLGSANGISFVNDSKATTLESVLSAVESFEDRFQKNEDKKLWLLLGGKDKNLPWERLSALLSKPYLQFVLFGECRDKILKVLGSQTRQQATLKEALESLRGQVKIGDIVLLSPGGTSLDEFKSFEHRGDSFRIWVQELFGDLK